MSAEAVVAMLIAWEVGRVRNNPVLCQLTGLAGEALDHAVRRIREAVLSRLGDDAAVSALLAEARATGQVSDTTEAEATVAVRRALAEDGALNQQVQQAVSVTGSHNVIGSSIHGGGNAFGDNNRIRYSSKVIHRARNNPGAAAAVIVAVLALLGLGAYLVSTAAESFAGGSAVSARTIEGTWTPSDGTGSKIFSADGGRCSGFYYNNGTPLDIGGPMTCTISGRPDAQGRYKLQVSQGGNTGRYLIEFTDPDHGTVLDGRGTKLYDIERF